jgi:hypothetical protein
MVAALHRLIRHRTRLPESASEIRSIRWLVSPLINTTSPG